MQDASVHKAKAYVYRLLNIRLRSEQEIRDRLIRRAYLPDCVERVIQYFSELRLIDDYEFSCQWATCRFVRHYGIQRVKYELIQKGIAKEVIDTVLAQTYDAQKEGEVIRALLSKCLLKYSISDLPKNKRRVYDYLKRRGFNTNTINRVFDQYDWK
ncbi:MAG: RecX family transcriptional regulator [Candidatus Omnitrophica bacterium]|nr:RecX family transcriptional regulator [Candidatus Omnitrophota bacterium]